jgi:hypothetical protein
MDDGSDTSYLRKEVLELLGIRGTPGQLEIATITDEVVADSERAEVTIENMEGNLRRRISVWTMPDICTNLRIIDWATIKARYEHLSEIPFPSSHGGKTVDMLLGSDYPELMVCLDEKIGDPGEPIARKTPLGWTCVGRIKTKANQLRKSSFCTNLKSIVQPQPIDEELRALWNQDLIDYGEVEHFSEWEKKAMEKTAATLRYVGDRYEVGIPWKNQRPGLPDNREAAEKRLRSLEASFKKRPEVKEQYREAFKKNIEKGYISKISQEKAAEEGWYLPHFAVIKQDKQTTKVRIVYDAAAKYEGCSLNDEMFPGPNLQRDIVDILLNFRRRPVGLVGDIKEMFSQIALKEEDQRYHRLLWRDLEPNRPMETYEAVRLVFGDRASPYLAMYILKEQAKKAAEQHPTASQVIQNYTYMDDVMSSFETTLIARQMRDELQTVVGPAGFSIRKWGSNSGAVLEGLNEDEKASGVKIKENELPSVKTLGVWWDAEADTFTYSVKLETHSIKTKRKLLSIVASIFDPFQFLAPIVIRGKIALQLAWMAGTGWDETLPPDVLKSVNKWTENMIAAQDLRLTRCYRGRPIQDVKQSSIHIFTDASKEAYAAVAYIRFVYIDNSIEIAFVAAKARVTPLRAVSIPRLELMGAILGVRLARVIAKNLQEPIGEHFFWSDSTDVIYWVKGQSRRFKPFVANRIAEIHEHTTPQQWRHVPGIINSADDATRGLNATEMNPESRWCSGPAFLRKTEAAWPIQKIGSPVLEPGVSKEAQCEEKQVTQIQCHNTRAVIATSVLPLNRFSDWIRLRNVVAWMLCLSRVIPRRKKEMMAFTPKELRKAEVMILREVQRQIFGEDLQKIGDNKAGYRGNLQGLSPFIDEDGLLRVGGRLNCKDLSYDTRHPIILPKQHHVTELIITYLHEKGCHVRGTNGLLADVRERYWPIHGREVIKRIGRNCIECKKQKKRLCGQVMAPLPTLRTEIPLRAFAHCGVDYGGPFNVKITRNRREKRYLCLFTCLSSRAVHLEIAFGLDTASFLNALSRMTARRGRPLEMVSDNGTNFIGAERELRELLSQWDQKQISRNLAENDINWHFNPPLGSHHGGIFEIMIKAVKRGLRAILGDACITDEELLTAVTEVEGLLNSRPLTYCGKDPKDETILTPNHFLIGQAGGRLAPAVTDEVAFNPRNRWRYTQELVRKVWVRWQREYLSLLQNRSKWQIEQENLKTGDIVLMADPANPRGRWPLGRITEVFPGDDGKIRTVMVYSGAKEWRRPITKLSLLIQAGEEEPETDVMSQPEREILTPSHN